PDDTNQVFIIIRALSGDSFEKLYQRVLAYPDGDRILRERTDILSILTNRAALMDLPEGSLGNSYARFMETEQISADGLVEASNEDQNEDYFLDARASVLSKRLRDTHDLWHVVTGFGRDLIGEAGLLAFVYAQLRNRGIGFIVAVGAVKLRSGGHPEAPGFIADGYRRGKRAKLLAAADWEALLPLPLDEVRARLGVEPTKHYEPAFSEEGTRVRQAA
ncbi:MAG: ubiquinone biosynthesis protein COQ4, partial [Hyphomicrobiaceae bacterium]